MKCQFAAKSKKRKRVTPKLNQEDESSDDDPDEVTP
jgi:hypothetical protein